MGVQVYRGRMWAHSHEHLTWRHVTVLAVLASLSACKRTEVVAAFPEEFVGVGLELRIDEDTPVVVRTLEGGSAESAGVSAGDRVLMIDETSTQGLSLGNAVMLIRGQPGTQVRLTIARHDERIIVVVPRRAMVKASNDYTAAQQR